jgi:hypothetical protein
MKTVIRIFILFSHSPSFADLAGGLELVRLSSGGNGELATRNGDISTTVNVLGNDMLVRIDSVLRLNGEVMGTASGSGMDWKDGVELRVRGESTRRRGLGSHSIVSM